MYASWLGSVLFGKPMKLGNQLIRTQIARFMGPTWGPSGADRTQVGPMLAPWTLLSGYLCSTIATHRTLDIIALSKAQIEIHVFISMVSINQTATVMQLCTYMTITLVWDQNYMISRNQKFTFWFGVHFKNARSKFRWAVWFNIKTYIFAEAIWRIPIVEIIWSYANLVCTM